MKVLIAYASRHGSTAGVAERIAADLTASGLETDAVRAFDVEDVSQYDAFIVGAAAYMFHWLKDATKFAKRHKDVLAARPLWLFSSGPLGTDVIDADGEDVFESSRPKEFDELSEALHPRDVRVFFGAWDPDAPPVGAAEHLMKLAPAAKGAMPAGDFRDWDAIDAWAQEIVTALQAQREGSRS